MFLEEPNGNQLESTFLDMLDVFGIDTMTDEVRQQLLTPYQCDEIIRAFMQMEPWQRWFIMYAHTLDNLSPEDIHRLAVRLEMESKIKEGQKGEETTNH